MGINKENSYDVSTYIAEIYDLFENHTNDVELIKELILEKGKLNILEPFCGTGRISLPLSELNHNIIGIDSAKGMLDLFQRKIKTNNITLICDDVLNGNWPQNNDLIILGNNCFYELATSYEQESLIEFASKSLKSGGYLFIDGNHMEGELDKSWQTTNDKCTVFKGKASEGSIVEYNRETISYDVKNKLAYFKREVVINKENGEINTYTFFQQKHPVSTYEIQKWLILNDFVIEQIYGDVDKSLYSDSSNRVVIWAKKK